MGSNTPFRMTGIRVQIAQFIGTTGGWTPPRGGCLPLPDPTDLTRLELATVGNQFPFETTDTITTQTVHAQVKPIEDTRASLAVVSNQFE